MNTIVPPILDRLSALGDETRTRILALLDASELTVTEIASILRASQPTVSRHLKTLAGEGWVQARVDGRNRHYRMAPSLDDPARALWNIVSAEIEGSGVYAMDRERAREVLKERRLRSEAFFASAAERWDETREQLFGFGARTAPLFGLLRPEWTVADLGAGTGALAESLAPWVGKVIAVDRSEQMLDAARLRLAQVPNVDLRQGDLEDLPIKKGEVDVAILTLVLHYVVDPPAVLAQAYRALASGGTLVVVDMRLHERAEPYAEEMGHVWPGFEPERMTAWLEQVGFTSARTAPLPPDPKATGPLLFLASALKP